MNYNKIIDQFNVPGGKKIIKPLGKGKVHETFLAEIDENRFVLQKINTNIFPDIKAIMHNFNLITSFLIKKNQNTIELVRTKEGKYYYLDKNTCSFWRITKYISNGCIYNWTKNLCIAFEAGRLLGIFHKNLSELPLNKIKSHVRDFHNTPVHYLNLKHTLKCTKTVKEEISRAFSYISERLNIIYSISNAHKKGIIKPVICHNDPKLSNMVFDRHTKKGICLIDLDSIDIGLLPYDYGDAVRSICFTGKKENLSFNFEIFKAFSSGYLEIMASRIDKKTLHFLYTGAKTVTLELSMRYLTDYLTGNKYFKVKKQSSSLENSLRLLQILDKLEKYEYKASRFIKTQASSMATAHANDLV